MTDPSRYDQLSPLDAPLREQLRAAIDALGKSETQLAHVHQLLATGQIGCCAHLVRAALEQPAPASTPAPASWLLAGTRDHGIPTQHAFTARPVDPDTERAATERAVQAAADSEKSAAWFAAHSQPAPAATEATEHHYLSTGCLHDQHGYCQSHTGQAGAKTPAQCKFCQAPCTCPCHKETPGA
ncbi:hypothetical protein OG342_05015 [Streptomyces bobili]|uniref:hypothetical protein n=1 Tax=Streptomyces bobili TaxID=67280 RepID=UPI002257DF02|nr:hypothetical protein [Streptomyces bobili]MCX5522228.1 hypothetical protein [Streptomyces bobili]